VSGTRPARAAAARDPAAARARLRARLRREGGALPACPVGTVPILWNNVDVEELRLGTPAADLLDEIARLGYDGTQLGLGFPEGDALRAELGARDLRLAEVYFALRFDPDGPRPGTVEDARERLGLLHAAGGDVLCVALDGSPDRDAVAGRADRTGIQALSDDGWARLVALLDTLAAQAIAAGHRLAFHPHAGTYVETPAEVDRLVASTDPATVGICLDVGHYLVGGGDPVAALEAFGERVTHIHLKDVDGAVLDRLRDGSLAGFGAAIRERLFTELGSGRLDLTGTLAALADRRYEGWLMVEQDSAWSPPSEAAAIGRRVLAVALEMVGRERRERGAPADG
jgi:inosose dehydratase